MDVSTWVGLGIIAAPFVGFAVWLVGVSVWDARRAEAARAAELEARFSPAALRRSAFRDWDEQFAAQCRAAGVSVLEPVKPCKGEHLLTWAGHCAVCGVVPEWGEDHRVPVELIWENLGRLD